MKRKFTTPISDSNTTNSDPCAPPSSWITKRIGAEEHQCAQRIGITAAELQDYLALPNTIPEKILWNFWRITNSHQLDPTLQEVELIYEDHQWRVFIGISGWLQLMNRHPAFTGLQFTYGPYSETEVPAWVECTIHRSDRITPITVREYRCEVQRDTQIWGKMPRRMLRHRALQQCARLALGISLPDITMSPPKIAPSVLVQSNELAKQAPQKFGIGLLKEKLEQQSRASPTSKSNEVENADAGFTTLR